MIMSNLILNVDSYKPSQWLQYPPGTTNVFSYGEARGTTLPVENPETVFFGLQAFIKQVLAKPITMADINEAEEILTAHGEPFNRKGWEYILKNYGGFLPLNIKAVREGTVVPTGNILFSVQATDPECYWVTSYIETALLRAIWYPVTVASNGLRARRIIKEFMDKTADYDPIELNFKLHDFGARGVSSEESAGIGGAAHLLNSWGTDTISGIMWARKYYNTTMPGFSIPASEHSTITSWGKEREVNAFANMLDQFGGEGKIVACVSDSWDIDKAVVKWASMKNRIAKMGGTLVVRPDSGDPVETPIRVILSLMKHFGYTENSKGYKVLPSYIRVIQGDGITVDSMKKILTVMESQRLSASNIAFGMGAGTLQLVNRDTYKFAMKCSAVEINGMWQDVWKEAPGKPSKRGRMTLVQDRVTKKFRTVGLNEPIGYDEFNVMNTVYHNHPIEEMYTSFENVRSEIARYV